jgi:hypothetical protein
MIDFGDEIGPVLPHRARGTVPDPDGRIPPLTPDRDRRRSAHARGALRKAYTCH